MEEKLIDAFLNLFPFTSWLEKLGLNKEQSTGLSMLIVVVCLWLVWLLFEKIKNFKEERKKLKAAKDLKPYFDYEAVEKATRYYVSTQGQQISPAREEEPGLTHKVVLDRKPLISYFIEKAFSEKSESERFYLVLADSGMGKTTFMVVWPTLLSKEQNEPPGAVQAGGVARVAAAQHGEGGRVGVERIQQML